MKRNEPRITHDPRRPIRFRNRRNRRAGVGASLSALLLLFAVSIASAQELLPNGHFEDGGQTPAGWRLVGAGGATDGARGGRRAIQVQGKGDGQSVWRSDPVPLEPEALYRLRFFARGEMSGGCAVAGAGRVNRDFHFAPEWREAGFVFAASHGVKESPVRLGQWHTSGRVDYDDASLTPAKALHRQSGGVTLGEAESIRGGVYRFEPNFSWHGSNAHRPLVRFSADFNSDRWPFSQGAELVYRFAVAGRSLRAASVRLNVGHYTSGTLRVEAGRDGAAWQAVGEFDGAKRSGTLALPESLFPAPEIFVRLAMPEAGGLQVNAFAFEAPLDAPTPDMEGATHFLEVRHREPSLQIACNGLRRVDATGRWEFDFTLAGSPASATPLRAVAWAGADAPPPDAAWRDVPARGGTVTLGVPFGAPGRQSLRVRFADAKGAVLFDGGTEAETGLLQDRRPGYWLADDGALGLWWCESGWKIGRDRGLPDKPGDGRARPVRVTAAGGEYEAAQVILRPARETTLLAATVSPLRNERGEAAPVSVRLDEVAYVRVTRPTDASCQRGDYPDPLPPLHTPLALPAGRNQPLWLTFHVPPGTAPGTYRGELELKTAPGSHRVPLEIEVHPFTLPEVTHLRSAFGLSARYINTYHRLKDPAQKREVYEKYLANFAEHRISPYSFFEYSPIRVRFTGDGADKKAEVNFTAFDAAAEQWLDRRHFNTFRLPLRGMGGGTFHSRHLGTLEGHEEGSAEHTRLFRDYLGQVERHLRERGWLDRAYTYWFDEPDAKDYDFVVAGQRRIKAAAPGLRRMLTEHPEAALLDDVDIWCGLTPEWTPEKVRARRAAGQEVWWYVCCSPKEPFVTEFIDHPGIELRLWPWQSWQYDVQGILVWETLYWTSDAAFPPPQRQDPWSDPMSYVSGYDQGPGHIGYWGNGDGRFLYPPRPGAAASTGPDTGGPVNSLRWENLRDGMEDYEYFWMLREAVAREVAARGESALTKEARALLTVPPVLSTDLTHFTTDPRELLAHRERIARMLARLSSSSASSAAPVSSSKP